MQERIEGRPLKATTSRFGVVRLGSGITLDAEGNITASGGGGGSVVAGAGLTKTVDTLDVVAADNSMTINADSLQVKLDGTRSVTVAASGIGVNLGDGLEHNSNAVRAKLDGASLTRSASGLKVTTPFNITETEIDFGSTPVSDKTFTVVDAAITGASKIMVTPSGSPATGRVGDDWAWDQITFAAAPGTGQFTLYANAGNNSVVGLRKVLYSYA
jgi:hypothetical protein